jgi:hypothetical protein
MSVDDDDDASGTSSTASGMPTLIPRSKQGNTGMSQGCRYDSDNKDDKSLLTRTNRDWDLNRAILSEDKESDDESMKAYITMCTMLLLGLRRLK